MGCCSPVLLDWVVRAPLALKDFHHWLELKIYITFNLGCPMQGQHIWRCFCDELQHAFGLTATLPTTFRWDSPPDALTSRRTTWWWRLPADTLMFDLLNKPLGFLLLIFMVTIFFVKLVATVQPESCFLGSVNWCWSGISSQIPRTQYSCCDSRHTLVWLLLPPALCYGLAVSLDWTPPCLCFAGTALRNFDWYSCSIVIFCVFLSMYESMILSCDKPHEFDLYIGVRTCFFFSFSWTGTELAVPLHLLFMARFHNST